MAHLHRHKHTAANVRDHIARELIEMTERDEIQWFRDGPDGKFDELLGKISLGRSGMYQCDMLRPLEICALTAGTRVVALRVLGAGSARVHEPSPASQAKAALRGEIALAWAFDKGVSLRLSRARKAQLGHALVAQAKRQEAEQSLVHLPARHHALADRELHDLPERQAMGNIASVVLGQGKM